jgi:hypothetical protein
MEILPDDVISSLFTKWLTVDSVSRFDTAIYNRTQRTVILDAAYNKSPGFRYPVVQPTKTVDPMVVWICHKKIPMRGLRLTPSLVKEGQLLTSYLEACWQKLEWTILKVDATVPNVDIGSFSTIGFERHFLISGI